MNWVMGAGVLAGLIWVCTLPWGAFPPPRVKPIQNFAATIMVLAALTGLIHAVWITSP